MRFICTRPLPYVSPSSPGHSDLSKREQYHIEAASQELAFVKMCGLFPSDCSLLIGKFRVDPRDVFTVDYEVSDAKHLEERDVECDSELPENVVRLTG